MRRFEHEPVKEAYWQSDFLVDGVEVPNYPKTPVRFKAHTEQYLYKGNDSLLRLSRTKGTRTWFRGSLYLPEYGDKAIGAASTSYYPAPDRALVTWECFLGEQYHDFPPANDALLQAAFHGWEKFLTTQCPDAERLVVPNWDPVYRPAQWQEFLHVQGYRPLNESAFVKEVERR